MKELIGHQVGIYAIPVITLLVLIGVFDQLTSMIALWAAAVVLVAFIVRYVSYRQAYKVPDQSLLDSLTFDSAANTFLYSTIITALAVGIFSVAEILDLTSYVSALGMALLLAGLTGGYIAGVYCFLPALIAMLAALWLPAAVYGLMVIEMIFGGVVWRSPHAMYYINADYGA